ncbi:GNAT family N-acetyltransferase [Streptomyces sp. NPDC058374]|uniref:GNAT family N-acetyltransferase n=1 Tax=unclassified Streptomyces TaxID=2593676 RepID=UPI0036642B9D
MTDATITGEAPELPPPAPPLTIREITEEDLDAWGRAYSKGNFVAYRPASLERRRRVFEPGRWLGAYEREECVGTFRGLALDLSVPGGALLPVLGVSSLAVAPSHRRRGLLRAMMAHGLGAAVERGEQATRLLAAGLVTEVTPGATRVADALFRTAAEPWCPDHF